MQISILILILSGKLSAYANQYIDTNLNVIDTQFNLTDTEFSVTDTEFNVTDTEFDIVGKCKY